MACGCSRNNKINKNEAGNRVKLKQKCSPCKFEFLSSVIHNCCPKCGKDIKKVFKKRKSSKS